MIRETPGRFLVAVCCCLAISSGSALAQSGGGGGASSGGGASAPAGRIGGGGGALSPGVTAPAAPGANPSLAAPTSVPQPSAPGSTAPSPDPQRNNVDVNPPTRRLPGTAPSISPAAPNIGTTENPGQSFTPPPGRAQAGAASSRPGTATSANSDGYAECMNLWSPSGTRMSKQEWSATCNSTRLPPR